MKIPFKRDTASTRRQVLEETSKAASQLTHLRSQREKVLVEADDIDAVKRIDDEIAALERTVAIHQDRLRALAEQLKGERNEQREVDREAAIKVIQKKLAVREVLAEKLEQAIKDAGDAYFELTNYPSPLISDWHFPLPRGYRQIDIGGINREVSLALYSASRPIQGQPRMPSASSLDTGVAGITSETISGVVARQNRDLVQLLRVMSIGRDDDDMEAA